MRMVWGSLLAAAALLLCGCTAPPQRPSADGVILTPLRSVSTVEAQILLRLSGVKDLAVRHPVDLYRMEYAAAHPAGRRLTGLLAWPRGVEPRRLVSFQHGTSTTRSAVPSAPDGTGLAAAIAFAGNGYLLIAPDYPGLGGSEGRHPYYIADAVAGSVTAMIEAARRLDGAPTAPVFLSGFSEGGWASMAALRELEARGSIPVLGAAPVAGPFNLRGVSLPAALKGGAPAHSLYLAYIAWAYADHYGRPLDSVLTSEYAAVVERVFAGAKPKEILAALPGDPRLMFNQDFLEAFDHGGRHWFLDALAANGLTEMTPLAPVRLYYGAEDKDVVPEESLAAARAIRARGGDTTAINVGPVGHDASMLAAAPRILAWLKELEAAEASASPRKSGE